MPGGLIQLLTTGLQDAPLILNPEITFFKTVYRKHTNFVINQLVKNIGPKKFNTFHQFKINNVSDLLSQLYFIIDIPYFNVKKTLTNTSQIINSYQINELSVNYGSTLTYLFYESVSNQYVLIPKTYFNLSKNDNFYNQVSGIDIQNNLLANLNLLTTQNYGIIVNIFQLINSKLNQLIPVFRLNFNQWAEMWIRIFEYNTNNIYFLDMIGLEKLVINYNKKLDVILYDGFINYNVFDINNDYLNFCDEVLNYFNYSSTVIKSPVFDTDYAQNYAILNSYNINTYKSNVLHFNSLFYLFMLQNLYPNLNTNVKTYTFWKKYTVGLNNIVNNNTVYTNNNYFLEWKKRFDFYRETSYGIYESLQLQIYQKYKDCGQNIIYLFNSLEISGKEKLWCTLKAFYNQMTDNVTNVICFEDHFNPNSTTLYLQQNIQNIYQNVYSKLLNKSNLNTSWTNFDDPAYIQPVDLSLIYPYLSYNFINLLVNSNDFDNYHFLVLWRNKITIALSYRVAYNLDNYYSEKVNTNSLQNTFLNLNDYGETNKSLTFYHNINLNRNIKLNNLRDEMNTLFFSESYYGTISIDSNDLSNNLILILPSYTGLPDMSYNMVNQNVEKIDENSFNYIYDLSNNIITINDWNSPVYDKIYLNVDNVFIEMKKFNFNSNSLLIYPDTILSSLKSNIQLKLVKNLLVPLVDFNAIIDVSGNINYPNININVKDYPDTSFNYINYPDISYNTINLYSLNSNNIVVNNQIYNNIISVDIPFSYNNNYEFKIKFIDNTIQRLEIIIDSNNNIITPLNLDLDFISRIDLLIYNFNLNLVESNITTLNNIINPQFVKITTNLLNVCNNIASKQITNPLIATNMVAVGSGNNSIIYYNGVQWIPSVNGNSILTNGLDVAYNGTTWVAVGSGPNCIARSLDGINWVGSVNGNSIFTLSAISVRWLDNKWCVVGSGSNNLAYSTDGLNWSAPSNINSLLSVSVSSILYNGGVWVAGSSSLNPLAYSMDGSSWTSSINGNLVINTINKIIWNGTIFVAVGSGNNSIATSTDGQLWTGQSSSNAFFNNCYDVVWNGFLFVAVGTGTNSIAYSSDGINWLGSSNGSSILSVVDNISWNGDSMWIINNGYAGSTDAINWFSFTETINQYNKTNIVSYNGTTLLAGGNNSKEPLFYYDISGWTIDISFNNLLTNINNIIWSPLLNLWVACGSQNCLVWSTNGKNWTASISILFNNVNNIAYANNIFIAVGSGANSMAKSIDGLTWTPIISGNNLSSIILNIKWNGTLWIATCIDSSIGISKDSNTWYKVDSNITNLFNGQINILTADSEMTTMVMGGNGNEPLFYSKIANTWLPCIGSSAIFNNINTIVYSNGLWVAGGNGINVIATSTDGINWVGSNNAFKLFNQVNSIATDGSGTWIAVGNCFSSFAAISSDGMTWELVSNFYPFVVINPILSILWNGSVFVIKSSNGDYLYSTDGISWVKSSNPSFKANLNTIAVDSSMNFLIGNNGDTPLLISTDASGSVWNSGTNNYLNNINKIVYYNDTWVAGGTGQYSLMYGSISNGNIVWTPVSDVSNFIFCDVTDIGFDLSQNFFIAVGNGKYHIATSSDGIEWTKSNNDPFTTPVTELKYDNIWIAKSDITIAYSSDGMTWEILSTVNDFGLVPTNVSYNGAYFLLYGTSTSGNTILIQDNSNNWILPTSEEIMSTVNKVIYDNNGSLFLAGGVNSLSYSTDGGNTWLAIDNVTPFTVNNIVNYNNNWIAIGTAPTYIAKGTNNSNWTDISGAIEIFSNNGCTSVDSITVGSNYIITIGIDISNNQTILYSNNLNSWTQISNYNSLITASITGFNYTNSIYFAYGNGSIPLQYSIDNITWYPITNVSSNSIVIDTVKTVKYVDGVFFACGSGLFPILFSEDGMLWNTSYSSSIIFSICNDIVSDGSNNWVSVGYGSNTIAFSNSSGNWLPSNLLLEYMLTNIVYNGTTFIANSDKFGVSLYSQDGQQWTNILNYQNLMVCSPKEFYENNGLTFFYGNGNNPIVYTTDLSSFNVANGANLLNNVNTISYGNNTYYAGGSGNSSLLYSSDGINWLPDNDLTPLISNVNTLFVELGGIYVGGNNKIFVYKIFGGAFNGWQISDANTIFTNIYTINVFFNVSIQFSLGGHGITPFYNLAYFDGNSLIAVNTNLSGIINKITVDNFLITVTNTEGNSSFKTPTNNFINYPSELFPSVKTSYNYFNSNWLIGSISQNPLIGSSNGLIWKNISNSNLEMTNINTMYHNTTTIVIGGNGNYSLIYSTDGITLLLTNGNSLFNNVNKVLWNGSMWLAGGSGSYTIATSTNGISWIGTLNTLFTNVIDIAWNGSYWVAIGNNLIANSSDGETWTQSTTTFTNNIVKIHWNNNSWEAIDSSNNYYFSTDAMTWNTGTNVYNVFATTSNTISNHDSVWLIGSTSNIPIIYSSDGLTWVPVNNTVLMTSVNGIAYNGNYWVAVGLGVCSIATSLDGMTWTPSNNDTNIFSKCYNISWNGTIWVVVGQGISNIAYSSNGMDWIASLNDKDIFTLCKSILWNGSYWVSGGGLDNGNEMGISTDGINWGITFQYSIPITIIPNTFYWLIAYKDNYGNLLPNKVYKSVKIEGNNLILIGDANNLQYDLFNLPSSLVPNLFPILHHYLNTDLSGNIINYQLNSDFYQKPYIFNTYHKYLAKDTSHNLIDSSGYIIDMQNHRLNATLDKIIQDLNKNIYNYTIDISGNMITSDGYKIIIDPSGDSNYFVLYDTIGLTIIYQNDGITPIYLEYLYGNGLFYINQLSAEPLYYFYNFPTNKYTTSIKINGKNINKLLQINGGEFFIKNQNTYPAIFDILKLKSNISFDSIVSKYNSYFNQIFLEDPINSPIVNLIEETNKLYENLNLDGINILKSLGQTISSVIDNTTVINNLNLINYNSYDYQHYSLFTPYYYNLSSATISSGIGIQKFLIANKGPIFTQSKQIYESSSKISQNLQSYLNKVSSVLLQQINYVNTYQDLNNALNPNGYQNTFLPKYQLENTINTNLYTITDMTVETLFNLNGNYTDSNTEIYLNNELIDISTNNIASGKNMFEISEENIYKNTIVNKPKNDFDSNKFNYIGPVNFDNGSFIFNKTYNFVNDISNTYLLLDDNNIIKYSNTVVDPLKIYYNSYECILNNPIIVLTEKNQYVYQVEIDISNNVPLTGNSMIINFSYYKVYPESNNKYIIIGDMPLELKTSWFIYGNSTNYTYDSFIPFNLIVIKNIRIYKNFKSGLTLNNNNGSKVYSVNNILLDFIYVTSINTTFYSYASTTLSNITLYDISNKILIPPMQLTKTGITLLTNYQDFIMNNYNDSYFYKLEKEILKGSQIKSYTAAGNFNLWIYPQNNLKLVNTEIQAYISNGEMLFSSTTNLPNQTYYYLNGYVYYIDIISNPVLLTNYYNQDSSSNNLYILSEDNFDKREQQYISIIDSSSTEFICPDIDMSNNNIFNGLAGIKSYFSFDIKNKGDNIFKNEVDIIGVFEDGSQNRFMIPYSFNYLEVNSVAPFSVAPLYILHNNLNYYSFFVYKKQELNSYNLVTANISEDISGNSNYTYITCDEPGITINKLDNNYSITIEGKSDLQKYKLYIGAIVGDDVIRKFTYIWTLMVDNTNTIYDNMFDIRLNPEATGVVSPINVYENNKIFADENIFRLNQIENYVLVNQDDIVYMNNSYVSFNNINFECTRQQYYYHSNILFNGNKIKKLTYNYEPGYYFPDLTYLGIISNINGNKISFTTTSGIESSLYLIFKSNNQTLYSLIENIDIVNNIIIVQNKIPSGDYSVYASSRHVIMTLNEINIFVSNNKYFISSYQKNDLKIEDVIMIDDHVFEIIGLNSVTLFYDLKLINKGSGPIQSYYQGYYYLYRTNSVPVIPEIDNVVEFSMNNNFDNKLLIDSSFNLILAKDEISTYFSINEGEYITLYLKNGVFYNIYNYNLRLGDYIIYLDNNEHIYRVKYNINGKIYLSTDMIDNYILDLPENFYSVYLPYQPCRMVNLVFDSSGNLTNTDLGNFYFELDGVFNNTNVSPFNPINNFVYNNMNFANSALYTRILSFPYQNLYFENKNILPLPALLSIPESGTSNATITINFSNGDNLSNYDLFFNQPILINTFINYIKRIILPNTIIVDVLEYPISANVNVFLGHRNDQLLYTNYLLDKSCYLKPVKNLGTFSYYDISNQKITNYDISNQLVSSGNKIIFADNVLNMGVNIQLNLVNSYHILLEKTQFDQYISYLCQVQIPNKLLIFGNIQNYNSQFFIDKIYPINLNIDNSFGFKDIIFYKQVKLDKLPENQIVIWKKYELIINGLMEPISSGYQIEIDATQLIPFIGKKQFFIDKTIPCSIINQSGNYYLRIGSFLENYNYIYTKDINYLKKVVKNAYTDNININPIFDNKYGIESVQLPTILNFETAVDYYYYTMNSDFNYFINNPNILGNGNLSAGSLNLSVVSSYINQVTLKRTFTTSNQIKTSEMNYIYINNLNTNIFDSQNIYLDSVGTLENIFNDTLFSLSTLFNPIKTWNTWSLVSNPDISKSVMLKGDLTLDSSGNISQNTSNNYYTKSEISDLSGFLMNLSSNYSNFTSLLYFQNVFYNQLPNFIRYENFWLNPIDYINKFLVDIGSSILITPTDILLNGQSLKNLIVNNQFVVSFSSGTYTCIRNIQLVNREIYNIINNVADNNIYGVKIDDLLAHIIKLSSDLKQLKESVLKFNGKAINFPDILFRLFKSMVGKTLNYTAVNNFLLLGLDLISNNITYNTGYDNVDFLESYPSNPTQELLNINIPYELNYSIDISNGLYPYTISLKDESFYSHTIYKIEFLEGENLLIKQSVDNPLVFNNQIQFLSKVNFDANHNFSILAYKTYDITSNKKIGYAYSLDISSNDLAVLNFSLMTSIKYKTMELTSYDKYNNITLNSFDSSGNIVSNTYNNYLIFPTYIDVLTSFIQAEINVAIDKFDISNNNTNIQLLKLNQTFNANSTAYTLYFSNNGVLSKVLNVNGKNLIVSGVVSKFTNTKLIITIKPINITYLKLILYEIVLVEPLVNYSYFFDLRNVPKNFLLNNKIRLDDLTFIGDSSMQILVDASNSSIPFQNIVQYSKLGEFPPEPIQNMTKMNSFLYQFSDSPPINDISSCFIYYDILYNRTTDDGSFILNFINNINTFNYTNSNDVISTPNLTQFISNIYIEEEDLFYHTFGGVINNWNITNYTYSNNILTIPFPANFVFDSMYYYLINNNYIDITNITLGSESIQISTNLSISGTLLFTQVIIEILVSKPNNNQLCQINTFDPLDIAFDGYIEALDKNGQEIGQYIYLLTFNSGVSPVVYNNKDSLVYLHDNIVYEGQILTLETNTIGMQPTYNNNLYIVTNSHLVNINFVLFNETQITYTLDSCTLVQPSFLPFTLYKKISLGNYYIFIREQTFNFLDNFNFNLNALNKFHVASKFATFEIEKKYNNETITPSADLSTSITTNTSTNVVYEQATFVSDLYRRFFEYVEFYIGDQLVEQINKDTMEIQYQFLKDPNKRNQIDKLVEPYEHNGNMRFSIPLEFWFNGDSTQYLPLICLNYTLVSLKFKINNLASLLTNTNYVFDGNIPEINVQTSIDGILLDSIERELFGNTQHEYIIERFKTYPDTLITNTSAVARMKFKNMVKDVFFISEVISSHENTYFDYTIKQDQFLSNYLYVFNLYQQFLKIGTYTATISRNYAIDFDYIQQANYDVVNNTERYVYFMESNVLSLYDPIYTLYLDSKHQQNLPTLENRRANLEIYYLKVYKNIKIASEISPISTLNIQSSGRDLFVPLIGSYFNLVVPYERYKTSVDNGYYAYSFSLNPLEKQPSGHVNFTMLDDIVVNLTSPNNVISDPYILKTTVREYQILRIMSGMGALAFFD